VRPAVADPANFPRDFEGKVALITGAAGGIGRATALAFAKRGADIVVADLNAFGGEETAEMIRRADSRAIFLHVDVSSAAQVESLLQTTIQTYQRLDFACNNAGIEGPRARVDDYTEEDWDRVFGVNLKGVWLCMKYELREMVKAGHGAIVNTASVGGLVGVRRLSAYSASKHAVVGLTRSAALDYGRAGIRVNAVCPGLIDTEMLDRYMARPQLPKEASVFSRMVSKGKRHIVKSFLAAQQPAGRLGSPEEVAGAIVWLCSDAASYVNGHALAVDGGFVAR